MSSRLRPRAANGVPNAGSNAGSLLAALDAHASRLEVDLAVVADRAVADLRVNRVRSRVREVRIETTEPASALQKRVAERRDRGRRVARATVLRGRVDHVDGTTRARLALGRHHRARVSSVDPKK